MSTHMSTHKVVPADAAEEKPRPTALHDEAYRSLFHQMCCEVGAPYRPSPTAWSTCRPLEGQTTRLAC